MGSLDGHIAETGISQLLDGLGDSVTHWPAGVSTDAETVTALVDRSMLATEFGDASNDFGEKLLLVLAIGVAPEVTVEYKQKGGANSVFVVDGERWEVDRILSRSAGIVHYRAVRYVQKTTKQSRRP